MSEKKEKGCDCINIISKDIVERAEKDPERPKGFRILRSGFDQVAIFPDTPDTRTYSSYIIKSTFEKKDGTESRPKSSSVMIVHTYCPFCGTKLPVE